MQNLDSTTSRLYNYTVNMVNGKRSSQITRFLAGGRAKVKQKMINIDETITTFLYPHVHTMYVTLSSCQNSKGRL